MDTFISFRQHAAILWVVLLPGLAMAAEHDPIDAFPPAGDGMTRFVIVLPQMQQPESRYGVELIIGRVMQTDGVNIVRMDAALNPVPLEGWGYTYYEMSGTGQTATTLMAPHPGKPEVEAFVHGPPQNIRYNSRLPIVAYAPEGFELRFRIWAAAENYLTANPG